MIKTTVFCLLISIKVFAQDLLYVCYGPHPQNELLIGYLDQKKEGGIRILKEGKYELLKVETTAFGKHLYLHKVLIMNLQPGQKLAFKAGEEPMTYVTKTLHNHAPRFCVAGDLYQKLTPFKNGITQMAKENPDFVIFGGDLAYSTHGPMHFPTKEFAIKRYQNFLKVMNQNLRQKDGSLIPIIAVIGNHDFKKGKDNLAYRLFFPPHAKTYLHYDLNQDMDLFVLDTGHMTKIAGLQTNFLKQSLKNSHKICKIAAYHIGAYPSYYGYDTEKALQVRQNFCPQFDRYHLNLAFEHHSHTFKITHPIKAEQVDPSGTIYCGDGCFGVKPRGVKNKSAFYIKNADSVRHYFLIEALSDAVRVSPKNLKGQLLIPSFEVPFQTQELTPQ